jgi:hypothetical protein
MKNHNNKVAHGAWGGGYGLALLGVMVYYLQHAATFWDGVLGVLKSLVWPAFVAYHLAGFLQL